MLDALLAPIDAPFATPTLAVAPNAFANGSSVAIDDSRVLATTTLRLSSKAGARAARRKEAPRAGKAVVSRTRGAAAAAAAR